MDSLKRWRDELLAQGYSSRTVQLRPYVVLLFARHAGVPPLELTTEHVLDYLRERDVAPRTRASYLTALQQWSAYVGRPDITDGIRRPRAPRTKPRPVAESALSRMLLAADPRHPVYAWVVVGAYAGTRSAETATLTAETLHEHLTGQALRIVGKGEQERVVPAAQVVVEALEPWVALARGRGRLWPTASATGVQAAVRRLADEAGVRCTSHMLRHRFGTQLFRHTRDLLLVQQLMGHASPSTTAIYVELAQEAGMEAVSALPGADRVMGEAG